MHLNLFPWLMGTALLIVFAWHERLGPWPPLRVAGALLCLTAYVLVSLARHQLGRAFSVTAQARQLVTTGLYARFRNPIYLFAELFIVGFALVLRSWWPVVIMVAAITIQVVRARKEAAVLEVAFGDDYRRYRNRTWLMGNLPKCRLSGRLVSKMGKRVPVAVMLYQQAANKC